MYCFLLPLVFVGSRLQLGTSSSISETKYACQLVVMKDSRWIISSSLYGGVKEWKMVATSWVGHSYHSFVKKSMCL